MTEFLKLNKSNCRNGYKCIRHCPVKSIRFSGSQARIVGDECVLCGRCFVVCPPTAMEIADATEQAKVLLAGADPVVASVAPSFVANYGVGIAAMEAALRKLGFAAAEETARGATLVKREYERILREGKQEVLISSCCPTVNLLIQKYYPGALPFLADVASPMQAHCMDIKARIPGAKTVFIGPCLSKKDEAERYSGPVDCALTFAELSRWLEAARVPLEGAPDRPEQSRARLFPTAGGILKTMVCDRTEYEYMAVDGLENCAAVLEELAAGGVRRCFLEMSACVGSCVGGPVMEKTRRSPVKGYCRVADCAGPRDFDVPPLSPGRMSRPHPYLGTEKNLPGAAELEAILKKMGKTKPSDELNCGCCGYDSCREKAVAVYQGKADLSMCLPFLKEKAESFSDQIIRNTPNGILVLNEELEVQQINDAARRILNVRSAAEVLGEQVARVLDPGDFLEVMAGKSLRDRRSYLAEYGRTVEETILYDQEYHILICLLRDVTEAEAAREKQEAVGRETLDIADRVVEKQMRVVQDIASLLGETAAETKLALTRLKGLVLHD